MGAADRDAEAKDLAEALARLGQPELTWPVLCERAGVAHAIADPLWRALGFPDVPPDEIAYTADDVRALQLAAEGLERLEGDGLDRALELIVGEARVVSAHLARIAEQQVDLLAQLQETGLLRATIADALEHGVEHSSLGWLIFYVLRRQLDEAIRRRGSSETGTEPVLVVGFVDLVDFTRSSSGLDTAEFGRVLDRFEALAWDEVTEAGGRLVKLIGDEAMFVSPPTSHLAEAGLAIVSQCGRDGLPEARGGFAAGPVLIRGGDYFGSVVNLASRIADAAPPGSMVIDGAYRSIVEEQRPELSLERLEPRELKGIGKTELWRLRRSGRPARPRASAPASAADRLGSRASPR